MNNIKISTRILFLVGLVSLLLLVVGGIGLYGINKTDDALESVYQDNTVAIARLEEVSRLMTRNRVLVMDAAINPTQANLEKRGKEFQSNLQELDSAWHDYINTKLEPKEALLAKEFSEHWARYRQEGLQATLQALQKGKLEEGVELYEKKISPLANPAQETLKKLLAFQVDAAKSQFESAVSRYETIRMVSMLSIFIGVLVAAGFGLTLTREISSAFAQAIEVSAAVAQGDLTHQVTVEGKDEIALLLRALGSMQESLRTVVSKVRSGSDGVADGSTEIAQGNNDLSARTEQQASALEQTTASMQELASTVKKNAETARQANQLASQASDVALRGGDVVSEVVGTMKGINESSQRIADIIGVIDSIAFQTNILALNAAVEAARAGEQGRGFAVVATEVRSLAGRSAEAAKEIKALISESVGRVEQGAALVDRAGVTMSEVVSAIRRVTDLVAEITKASDEQAMGVAQVGEAVTQMDQATQQNAALVEQMAAAASALNQQAQDLVHVVSSFKLNRA